MSVIRSVPRSQTHLGSATEAHWAHSEHRQNDSRLTMIATINSGVAIISAHHLRTSTASPRRRSAARTKRSTSTRSKVNNKRSAGRVPCLDHPGREVRQGDAEVGEDQLDPRNAEDQRRQRHAPGDVGGQGGRRRLRACLLARNAATSRRSSSTTAHLPTRPPLFAVPCLDLHGSPDPGQTRSPSI